MGSAMILDNAFLQHLDVQLVAWQLGGCELVLDIAPSHLNRQSSLQGGVIATLLDAACGYAGLDPEASGRPDNAVTVMLTISYVRKVDRGRIRAVGRLIRTGRSLYFATADLVTGTGSLVATAQGTFKRSAG